MDYDCYCCLAGPRPSRGQWVEASRGGPRLRETWPTAHWAPCPALSQRYPAHLATACVASVASMCICFHNIRRRPFYSLFLVESACSAFTHKHKILYAKRLFKHSNEAWIWKAYSIIPLSALRILANQTFHSLQFLRTIVPISHLLTTFKCLFGVVSY